MDWFCETKFLTFFHVISCIFFIFLFFWYISWITTGYICICRLSEKCFARLEACLPTFASGFLHPPACLPWQGEGQWPSLESEVPTPHNFEEFTGCLCTLCHSGDELGPICSLETGKQDRGTSWISFQHDQKAFPRKSVIEGLAFRHPALPSRSVPQPRPFEVQNQESSFPEGWTPQPHWSCGTFGEVLHESCQDDVMDYSQQGQQSHVDLSYLCDVWWCLMYVVLLESLFWTEIMRSLVLFMLCARILQRSLLPLRCGGIAMERSFSRSSQRRWMC